MSIFAWIFLIISWSVIIILCGFCFYKLIAVKAKNITPELEIETEPKLPKRKKD